MSTNKTISVTVSDVTPQMVADQMVAAIEGGSGHWLKYFRPKVGVERVTEGPWYSDAKFWDGDFLVEAKADDEDVVRNLTRDKIQSGLKWLANNHLWRIEEIVEETGDAETGDVFLQACLLGDIVYG